MALLDLETIKEAVVLEHEDESGEKRLVAYLVSPGPSPHTVSELRRFLQNQLPDYMIPSCASRKLESIDYMGKSQFLARREVAPGNASRYLCMANF